MEDFDVELFAKGNSAMIKPFDFYKLIVHCNILHI